MNPRLKTIQRHFENVPGTESFIDDIVYQDRFPHWLGVGLASGHIMYWDMLSHCRQFRWLVKLLENPSTKKETEKFIRGRFRTLMEQPFEVRYEHPYESALSAYVCACVVAGASMPASLWAVVYGYADTFTCRPSQYSEYKRRMV